VKGQNLAAILIYLTILFHLLIMSGWVNETLHQPIQLAILALLLTALFVLRKKKRKSKRGRRAPKAEAQALAEQARETTAQDQKNS